MDRLRYTDTCNTHTSAVTLDVGQSAEKCLSCWEMSHRSVGGFKFACLPLLYGQVFVGRNSNLLFLWRFVELTLGLQLPRLLRVVWAWLDSCALAAGQRTSSPMD